MASPRLGNVATTWLRNLPPSAHPPETVWGPLHTAPLLLDPTPLEPSFVQVPAPRDSGKGHPRRAQSTPGECCWSRAGMQPEGVQVREEDPRSRLQGDAVISSFPGQEGAGASESHHQGASPCQHEDLGTWPQAGSCLLKP